MARPRDSQILTIESSLFALCCHRLGEPFKALKQMAVFAEYSNKITELGEKARELAFRRNALHAEVESLKDRLALLQLEREVNSLQNEIEALVKEKSELNEKLAAFDQVEIITTPGN